MTQEGFFALRNGCQRMRCPSGLELTGRASVCWASAADLQHVLQHLHPQNLDHSAVPGSSKILDTLQRWKQPCC